MQCPSPFFVTLQIPLALQKLQVVRVRVMEKRCTCTARRNRFHHCRHRRTTPHKCPHPTKSPSTSVAFFVTLWFSNLAPYVAILKTFHVKNYYYHCQPVILILLDHNIGFAPCFNIANFQERLQFALNTSETKPRS